jgi:hypothetical protein
MILVALSTCLVMTIQEDAKKIIIEAYELQQKIQEKFSQAGLMNEDGCSADKAYKACDTVMEWVSEAVDMPLEEYEKLLADAEMAGRNK